MRLRRSKKLREPKKSRKSKLNSSKQRILVRNENLLNFKDQIINTEDYQSLSKDEMLTDGIINLFITYQESEMMNRDQRGKFHIFDSIFYTMLTSRLMSNRYNEIKLSPVVRHYLNVADFTRSINIFE